jgi:carboxyl-terminal processing protease
MNVVEKMTKKLKKIISPASVLVISLVALAAFGFTVFAESDIYFKIHQSIDIFGKVYKEISYNYVDEVDPAKFMRAGIDGMLKTLDPYTVYLGEKEDEEVELITTGKYAGVGITISVRDSFVVVVSLMERYSAARQGIQIGDRLLQVDGQKVLGVSMREVHRLVRGDAGTELKMKIERDESTGPKQYEFTLVREEISINNIVYADFLSDGIAFVRLDRFSRTASTDLRKAIADLKAKGEIKGFILDLRDNPGGLLDIAVDVSSKFLPESSLVVTTRGRKKEGATEYRSQEQPMLLNMPLAILIDGNSASASEIVAGAIQDLDRGIIVGERSFGKGLVQTVLRISDNSSLKVTTARYYTPSGRCIQEVDYLHKDKDGLFVTQPDSLKKEFRTAHNRKVYEAGGIVPDSAVAERQESPLVLAIARKGFLYRFASKYVAEHKPLPEPFEVSDEMIKSFETYLRSLNFQYEDSIDVKLKDVKKFAEEHKFSKAFADGIDRLSSLAQTDREHLIERNKDAIRLALRLEIVGRAQGEAERIKTALPYDTQVQATLGLLKNKKAYKNLLSSR